MTKNLKWALFVASVPIVAYVLVRVTGDFVIGLVVWASALLFVAALGIKGMWDADARRFREIYGDDDE